MKPAPTYDDAVAFTRFRKHLTTQMLMQGLGIGYKEAATFIEDLQRNGVITAPLATGRRNVIKRRPNYSATELLASG